MKAKEIVVYKAESGAAQIPSVIIRLTQSAPDLWRPGEINRSLDAYAEFYDQEAQRLADVLTTSLPGGTLDRLLAKLLTMKASHFRVPWPHVEDAA